MTPTFELLPGLRLVQLWRGAQRHVAAVDEPNLRLLDCDSVVSLAQEAIRGGRSFAELVHERTTADTIEYDAVYNGRSDWRLSSPVDHPSEPSRLLVSGTGLTHLGSAKDRQAMHGVAESDLTDSMKMFRWGVEGGRPPSTPQRNIFMLSVRSLSATPCIACRSLALPRCVRPVPETSSRLGSDG